MYHKSLDMIAMNDLQVVSSIGRFIKSERLRQRKTQEELATESGIKRRTLSRIESGKPFDVLTLIALVRHLDHLEWFLKNFEIHDIISPSLYVKMQKKTPRRIKHPNIETIKRIKEKVRNDIDNQNAKIK